MFVGDDWAEQHHDVELMDTSGRRLAKARLPDGVAGMTKLHAMIAEQLDEAAEEGGWGCHRSGRPGRLSPGLPQNRA
nr:transposase [Streptosporangium amethystogenes]